jgi:hypothetical protein
MECELAQVKTSSGKAEGRAQLLQRRLTARCPPFDPNTAKPLLLAFDVDLDQAATIQQYQTALSLLLMPMQNVVLVNKIDDVPRVMQMPQSDRFDVRIWPLDSIQATRNSVLVSRACKVRHDVQLHVTIQKCSTGLRLLLHCTATWTSWQQPDMPMSLVQAAPGVMIDPLTLISYPLRLESAILRMLGNTVIAADDEAASAVVQRYEVCRRICDAFLALRIHKSSTSPFCYLTPCIAGLASLVSLSMATSILEGA